MIIAASLFVASVDIYISCSPYLTHYFLTSELVLQISLMLSPLTAGVIGLFYGQWIDINGRKPGILWALGIFTFGSLGCSLAFNKETFLVARFIQSLGGGGITVVVLAILSDMFKGVNYARYLATYSLMFPIVFTIAPLIGAELFTQFGWRSIFVFLSLCSFVVYLLMYFFVSETKTIKKQENKGWDTMATTLRKIIANKDFLLLGISHAVPIGVSSIFTINSSFIFIDKFGFTPLNFSYVQIIPTIFNIFGSLLYQQKVVKWGLYKPLRFGVSLLFVFIIMCFIGMIPSLNNPWVILSIMCILNFSLSALIATCVTRAFEFVAESDKGLAMAIIGFFRNAVSASIVLFTGFFFDGTMLPVYLCMVVFSLLNIWLVWSYRRQ